MSDNEPGEQRYRVTLPGSLARDLKDLADRLSVDESEVMRRALVLLRHSVEADEVWLIRDGQKQRVLLK